MGSEAEKAYAAFQEQVKRTVYIDNLSPQVTESVIRSALDQYGSVIKIRFIPNYTEPNNTACSALVELDSAKQAANVVEELNAHPFMMSGMPRPVRALPAAAGMFEDRPVKPGRKITLRWVDPNDPEFDVAQKLKKLARKHQSELAYLLRLEREEEEKLSKAQEETLKSTYQKYEKLDNNEKTCGRLAEHYQMKRHGC